MSADAIVVVSPPTKHEGVWSRLVGDRAALLAGGILIAIILAAIFAPLLAPEDPFAINLSRAMKPPSAANWLGTDATGRDILSRVLYGARLTLLIAIASVGAGGAIGALMGLLAAFYRRVDGPMMRLVDMMLAFPAILIGLAAAAIVGPGMGAIVLALLVNTIPDVARITRGSAVAVTNQEFMEAGRAIGLSDRVLIWRYLTLNCVSTVFVFLTLRFGQVVLIASALSFLGLGAQPPTAELGTMAAEGRSLLFLAPHIVTVPCAVIFVIVLAANIVGDALRDALDPRLIA
jgi:ABC-type dipeptide/oligopeptide/nickel transport system permease subunit